MLNFVLIKSLNMMLNGVRGVALASVLGPSSYGVFGTLIVIQQYLSYVALGMREGVAIQLARQTGVESDIVQIYSSALVWGLCCGLAVVGTFLLLHFGLHLVPGYFVWIGMLGLASMLNEILINVNRHENHFRRIAAMEFVFQATALLLVLCFWRWMTVDRAVQAVLLGLTLGLAGYATTMRKVRWSAVTWTTTRELIRIGILPALLSAVVVVFNSFFVLLANGMGLGQTIGLVVFGSNVSMMILFGLNTVSWVLTSRSMRRLYVVGPADTLKATQTETVDVMFRLGVIVAVIAALCSHLVFLYALKEYARAADFILHFCLFQSYGLLLFSESNFLSVNAKLRWALFGYAMVMCVLTVVALSTTLPFLLLVKIGVFAYFLLALVIAAYCRSLGFQGGSFRGRVVALAFPVMCVLAHSAAGNPAVALVCALFLGANLAVHRGNLLFVLRAIVSGRTAN